MYRGLTDVLVTYMLWLLDAVMLMMQCGVNMTRQEGTGRKGDRFPDIYVIFSSLINGGRQANHKCMAVGFWSFASVSPAVGF